MRSIKFCNNNFYHLYNRGVDKQTIYFGDDNYLRFIHGLTMFNDIEITKGNSISKYKTKKTSNSSLVSIHAFCLMPNHYHLLVEQLIDGGISKFMARIGNSYTKYFNKQRNRSGRLFQNVFDAKHIINDGQYIQTTKYIHKNPNKLLRSNGKYKKLFDYPWSSLQEILHPGTFPFVNTEAILLHYDSRTEYLNDLLLPTPGVGM